MRVKVKLKTEWSSLSNNPKAIVAEYRIDNSIFKQRVDVVRYYEGSFSPQPSFLYQLEELIENGVEEIVKKKVIADIVEKTMEKEQAKSHDERMYSALKKIEKTKITFIFDENRR